MAAVGILAVVTIFGAAIRLYRSDDPLWIDELHTAWTAAGDIQQVASRARMGNQSPPFFYLTWATTRVIGKSEFGVRFVSLVAGIVLIPLVAVVVYDWSRSTLASLLAAILLSWDTQFIFYAQEARPYALVQLIALLQIWTFGSLLGAQHHAASSRFMKETSLRVTFVALSALLIYLHYTTALVLVAEICCWIALTLTNKGNRYRGIHVATDMLVIILICVPSIQPMMAVLDRRANWWLIVEQWPTGMMLRSIDVYLLTPFVLTAIVAAGRRWLFGQRPILTPPRATVVLLVICWLAVPFVAAWMATRFEILPLARIRYVSFAILAAIVFASFCCASCPTTSTRICCFAVIIILTLLTSSMVPQFRTDGRIIADRNEHWTSIIDLINESNARKNWPVFLMPGLIEDHALAERSDAAFREYCLFPVSGFKWIAPAQRRLIAVPTTLPVRLRRVDLRAIAKEGGAWLIVRGHDDFAVTVQQDVQRQLGLAGLSYRVAFEHFQGTVKLLAIQIAER